MKKKSVGKNYIYNIIYQIFTLLIPLITTPYVAKILSVDGIGLYSFTYSIAYFFAIISELGTVAYARREIAFCQDDIKQRSKIFWEILIFRIFTVTISMLGYLIYIINSNQVIIGMVQSLYILAVIFDVTWFFQGMEDFKTVVIRNSIIKIIVMLSIFIFVKSQNDLLIYIIILALVPLIGNLVTIPILKKYICKVKIKELHPFYHFKPTMALFIPNIAAQVYLLLDKTMLGFMTVDNIENGYYEQAQKIIKMSWTFLTTFSTVLAPRIAYHYGKKNIIKMKEYLKKSFKFVWFLSSALAFGIIGISSNLIPWFLGNNYNKVITLLNIFAIILFPIGINSVTGTQYLITLKKHKIYTFSIIIGAILNLIMNYILIPKYYSVGAAIASVTAEFIIAIIQVIYVVKKLDDIKLKNIFSCSYRYLLSGFLMLIILNTISKNIAPSILNSFILIIIGAFSYLLILIFFKDEFVLTGIKKIKNLRN